MILPTMDNLVDVLKLNDIISDIDIDFNSRNFEDVYSSICNNDKYINERDLLEEKIYEYFSDLELPDEPNLYDYLILSLREKDIICTFNWDQFLIQAYRRNIKVTKSLPKFIFLHGNVMSGYCLEHQTRGAIDNKCDECGNDFEPSKLLYPIQDKDYISDSYIKNEWEVYNLSLKNALMITIFGYGAPQSDVKAIEIMKESWGIPKQRFMEEVEIIDIKSENELINTWKSFIHSHHYSIEDDFFSSWMVKHPRRSIEAFISQYVDGKFIEDNKVPFFTNFNDLWAWFSELIEVENNFNT